MLANNNNWHATEIKPALLDYCKLYICKQPSTQSNNINHTILVLYFHSYILCNITNIAALANSSMVQ